MGTITEELDRRFHGTLLRHCPTCTCEDHLEFSRKVTASLPFIRSPCREERESYYRQCSCNRCQIHDHHNDVELHQCLDNFYPYDKKISMLEHWFKRFDFDGDGYLNLMELKHLLDKIGASIREANIKRIFDRADKDRDGKLSFSEFLLMWRQAALLDEELSSDFGRNELAAIVRKHQLYPDVFSHNYPLQSCHCNYVPMLSENREFRIRQKHPRCICCRNSPIVEKTITHSYKTTPREEMITEPEKTSLPSKNDQRNRLPIFSCNRFPIY